MRGTAFAAPVTVTRSSRRLPSQCPLPKVAPVQMSASSQGVGDGNRGPINRSRLSEFAFAGGDRGIQDDLVREVMWRAAQVEVDDIIDVKIAEFDAGISDILSGMFDRRERDIIERNEQMALRAAHFDLARWNSTWREGQRESQKKRQEISAELAIVNKLLLARQSKKKRSKTSTRRQALAATSETRAIVGHKSVSSNAPVLPSAVVIGLVACLCLHGFDKYVEAHGAQSLAKLSLASLTAVVLVGQSTSLQKELSRRPNNWDL